MKIPVQKVLGGESRDWRKKQKLGAKIQMIRMRINSFQLSFAWADSFFKIISLRMMFSRSNSFAFC